MQNKASVLFDYSRIQKIIVCQQKLWEKENIHVFGCFFHVWCMLQRNWIWLIVFEFIYVSTRLWLSSVGCKSKAWSLPKEIFIPGIHSWKRVRSPRDRTPSIRYIEVRSQSHSFSSWKVILWKGEGYRIRKRLPTRRYLDTRSREQCISFYVSNTTDRFKTLNENSSGKIVVRSE